MGRPAQRVLVAGGAIGRFGRFVDQPLTAIDTNGFPANFGQSGKQP